MPTFIATQWKSTDARWVITLRPSGLYALYEYRHVETIHVADVRTLDAAKMAAREIEKREGKKS